MEDTRYSLTWMIGLLLAPHTLTLLGNLAGTNQHYAILWLALAAGLYWINVRSTERAVVLSRASQSNGFRPVLTFLQLTSRFITTIALSTVLLVTAGFVFNETFVYWFPNFAFAFALLGLVLAVNVWGRAVALGLQIGATTIVLLGLTSLIIAGIWGGESLSRANDAPAVSFHVHGIFAFLLLFAGFDLAMDLNQDSRRPRSLVVPWALMAIAVGMGVWFLVSLSYAPAAKLSNSFIPHQIVARLVLGETGRFLMGAVVIAGSVAAVNALFQSLARLCAGNWARLRQESGHHWLPSFERPSVWVFVIAAIVGGMMASGMAGTDDIDLYVRAGLVLWIFYYAGLNLSVMTVARRAGQTRDWKSWVLPAAGAVAMALGGVALITAIDIGVIFNVSIILTLFLLLAVAVKFFFKARAPSRNEMEV